MFESMDQVNDVMNVLKGVSIHDRELHVELANHTLQRSSPPADAGQQQQEAGEGDAL